MTDRIQTESQLDGGAAVEQGDAITKRFKNCITTRRRRDLVCATRRATAVRPVVSSAAVSDKYIEHRRVPDRFNAGHAARDLRGGEQHLDGLVRSLQAFQAAAKLGVDAEISVQHGVYHCLLKGSVNALAKIP